MACQILSGMIYAGKDGINTFLIFKLFIHKAELVYTQRKQNNHIGALRKLKI